MEILLEVPRIFPKPRMTIGDRRYGSMRGDAWRHFKNDVLEAWLRLPADKRQVFKRVKLSFSFNIVGFRRMDLKNLIAGVEDALIGLAFSDDSVDHVMEYETCKAVRMCLSKGCTKMSDLCKECLISKLESTEVLIREV